MHTTHTKIILGAHKGKDGKHPVQLRVTYVYARPINIKHKGRKVRMTKEEFAATQKQRFTKTEQAAREWSRIFAEIERHAEEIIESMDVFSFALFKEQFQGVKGDRENVYHWYIHSSAKTARDNYRSRSSIEAQRRAIEDILPPGESSSDGK